MFSRILYSTRLYVHAYIYTQRSLQMSYMIRPYFSRYLSWSFSSGLVVLYFGVTRLYSPSVLARIAPVSSDPASSVALFLNAVAFGKSIEHYEVFPRCFRAGN